jgi:hypothetical protein
MKQGRRAFSPLIFSRRAEVCGAGYRSFARGNATKACCCTAKSVDAAAGLLVYQLLLALTRKERAAFAAALQGCSDAAVKIAPTLDVSGLPNLSAA